MPCFTRVEILDDDAINRKARQKLNLPLEGPLSARDTRRVKVEAGVLRATHSVQMLSPGAIVRRKANKLTITVNI